MKVRIGKDGSARFIYSDALAALAKATGGTMVVKRASHVEPTDDGQWAADMSPVAPGLVLGPFPTRAAALTAEVAWLEANGIPAPR